MNSQAGLHRGLHRFASTSNLCRFWIQTKVSMDGYQQQLVMQAERRLGATLAGKYHLQQLLGLGGMAAVYKATSPEGPCVAVKVLHRLLCVEPAIRSRFRREAYVANRVNHEGVVRVIDDGVDEEGALFLVMDLLEGAPLDAVWEKHDRRLSPTAVLVLAEQVLEVLKVAHGAGIVHRDIKPENIYVTRRGHVKLLDFGVAHVAPTHGTTAVTGTGATLGTPAFMAPEQALGKATNPEGATDLYSLGAVMFTLSAGRYVHEAPTVNLMLIQRATEPAPGLGTVAPELPGALVTIVDRALAFSKEDRWQGASAMLREVRSALATSQHQPGLLAGLLDSFSAETTEGSDLASVPTMAAASDDDPPLARTVAEEEDSHEACDVSQSKNEASLQTPRSEVSVREWSQQPPKRSRWLALGSGVGIALVVGVAGGSLAARSEPQQQPQRVDVDPTTVSIPAIEPAVTSDVGGKTLRDTPAASSTASAPAEVVVPSPRPTGRRSTAVTKAATKAVTSGSVQPSSSGPAPYNPYGHQ